MRRDRLGWLLLAAGVSLGTVLDRAVERRTADGMLIADFHVHPHPGDGFLTIGQLRREARRRGLDVIAITPHNNRVALDLPAGEPEGDVLVIPGQEITTPAYHMIAIGTEQLVDWRLDPRAAAAEIHRQGGAAIAAHPVADSWIPRHPETLGSLDGIEIAHPVRTEGDAAAADLDALFAAARTANPTVAAIGASDFHSIAPLGMSRTYVFADERSVAAVVRAVRAGRTVARAADGSLHGPAELVARVQASGAAELVGRPRPLARCIPLLALAGLALIVSGRPGSRITRIPLRQPPDVGNN